MANAEKFEEIYTAKITRPGADEFLKWLKSTDFFTAPASTRFHGAYEGGLLEHSLNVYYELLPLVADAETAAICGLLHDVCKADIYVHSFRNVKNEETGKWERVPCYVKKDKFPYGHGEKSVYFIMKHMKLADEEAMAIRWHMGAYDDAARTNLGLISDAQAWNPLVYELHAADMRASLKEK